MKCSKRLISHCYLKTQYHKDMINDFITNKKTSIEGGFLFYIEKANIVMEMHYK